MIMAEWMVDGFCILTCFLHLNVHQAPVMQLDVDKTRHPTKNYGKTRRNGRCGMETVASCFVVAFLQLEMGL